MRTRFLFAAAAAPVLVAVLAPVQAFSALPPQDIGGHRTLTSGCGDAMPPVASREVSAVLGLVRDGATFSRPVEVDLKKNVIRMTIDGKIYNIRLPEAARARLVAAGVAQKQPARGCGSVSERG